MKHRFWAALAIAVLVGAAAVLSPATSATSAPSTLWVTMSDMSTTGGLKNVGAFTVDWCQLGFVQGVAAALASKTHKIGAVGAIPILPAKKTYAGMQLGAAKAVPGTTVDLKYS